MARRKDSPQKAAMREMMRDYLKNNDISIKDTGVGMSEEFIKHKLFVPFVQEENSARSKYTGTGLGMPIVKQLVEKRVEPFLLKANRKRAAVLKL